MSRDQILGRICSALGRSSPRDVAALEARLSRAPAGPIPARGQLPRAARIALFVEMAERAAASVAHLERPSQLPAAVSEFLARENLPARLKLAPDPALTGLPWQSRPLIELSTGPSAGDDAVSLCRAEAGVAESGTLVLASGPESPTTLNFLPETEIVMLSADDVVGSMEEAWQRLRRRSPPGSCRAPSTSLPALRAARISG